MEFDIMEHLTRWGPNRFNIAMHYDGYGEGHKGVAQIVSTPSPIRMGSSPVDCVDAGFGHLLLQRS
jgi:hypothetical protein